MKYLEARRIIKQEFPELNKEVKVQIARLFKEYKKEKKMVNKECQKNKTNEFYANGLVDGKLVALAEIKERLSNLSA